MGALTKVEGMETQTRPFKRSGGRGWGVQCLRIKRDGDRCGCFAIHGAYVCRKHGGQLPSVKASAVSRFQAMLNPAMEVLAHTMYHGKPADQIRAVRLVLRYSGITPQNVRFAERESRRALPAGKGAPLPLVDDSIEQLLAILMGPEDDQA